MKDPARLQQARENIREKFKAFKEQLEKGLSRPWYRPRLHARHIHSQLEDHISKLKNLFAVAEIGIYEAQIEAQAEERSDIRHIKQAVHKEKDRTQDRETLQEIEQIWNNFRRWLSR